MAVKNRKRPWRRFWSFSLVFALLFALLTAAGLGILSHYLKEMEATNAAKEASRPEVARDAYMEALTVSYVLNRLEDLYAQVDSGLQTEAEARAAVQESLSQGFGCKLSFSSAEKQTYLVYSKNMVEGKYPQIGSFTIAPKGDTVLGYTQWVLAEESFHMDWMLKSFTLTVPHSCTVWFSDRQLDSRYISGEEPYEALRHQPQGLGLPAKTVYTAGPVLGEEPLTVRDSSGNPVVIDETTNWSAFLNNCTAEQEGVLKEFTRNFLERYIVYTSSSANVTRNLAKLRQYILEGSDLSSRMGKAADGLQWTKTLPDELMDMQYHYLLALEDGRFLCDLSYVVRIHGENGDTEQTISVQLLLTPTDAGLKAETMTFY